MKEVLKPSQSMNTLEAVKNFSEQFKYEPVVENSGGFKPQKYSRYIFVGMGGSALAPDLLRVENPNLDIIIHRDYGLPSLSDEILKNCLIVVNSYSGNTEEALSAFNLAVEKKLSLAAITIGGKLLKLAQENSTPYIQMSDLAIQPRMALGLNFRALLKIIGEEAALKETDLLAEELTPENYEADGKEIAEKMGDITPVIYSSRRNGPLAYAWKVILNETAKIPAFSNVLPELNHNEMAGFLSRDLPANYHFVFLKDKEDDRKILKRMEVAEKLYREQGQSLQVINLNGKTVCHKIFSSIILAHWTAYHKALTTGADPDDMAVVEEFKRLMQ